MPKGYPNPKPEPVEPAVEEAPVEMAAVLLKRHYRPLGKYVVAGHLQPAIVRKLTGGGEIKVQEEKFVKDEMAPPPFPGAGIAGKVWAGTTLQLPIEEAKAIARAGIAERAWAD